MIHRAVTPFVVALFAVLVAPTVSAQEPAPATPAGPAPHITFDAKDINLGDVVHGKDAVAVFTYHNTGTAPLHILSAKPG